MATQAELTKERQLLAGMGLRPVAVWPPKCQWHNPDGTINGTLPCDPYSRLLYLGRGLRPDVAMVKSKPVQMFKQVPVSDRIANNKTEGFI